MTSSVGTTQRCAPEIWKDDGSYTEKVDVYSFGIILWELFAFAVPFADFKGNPVYLAMNIMQGARPNISSVVDCPAELKPMIARCWSANPGERPTLAALVGVLKKLISEEEDIPDDVLCPLCFEIMNPVVSVSGHSYCRACLEQAVAHTVAEPQTRQPMRTDSIIPNFSLHRRIEALNV